MVTETPLSQRYLWAPPDSPREGASRCFLEASFPRPWGLSKSVLTCCSNAPSDPAMAEHRGLLPASRRQVLQHIRLTPASAVLTHVHCGPHPRPLAPVFRMSPRFIQENIFLKIFFFDVYHFLNLYLLQYCLFYVLDFWPSGMWGLSSPGSESESHSVTSDPL